MCKDKYKYFKEATSPDKLKININSEELKKYKLIIDNKKNYIGRLIFPKTYQHDCYRKDIELNKGINILKLHKRKYNLKFKKIGYEKYDKDIILNEDKTIKIRLI